MESKNYNAYNIVLHDHMYSKPYISNIKMNKKNVTPNFRNYCTNYYNKGTFFEEINNINYYLKKTNNNLL